MISARAMRFKSLVMVLVGWERANHGGAEKDAVKKAGRETLRLRAHYFPIQTLQKPMRLFFLLPVKILTSQTAKTNIFY